jgi:hypothetical protein
MSRTKQLVGFRVIVPGKFQMPLLQIRCAALKRKLNRWSVEERIVNQAAFSGAQNALAVPLLVESGNAQPDFERRQACRLLRFLGGNTDC